MTELLDTDAVIRFLHETYERFATLIADENAERDDDARADLSAIGGFGICLKNRFGSEIEVGVGRDLWLLIRWNPKPTLFYRNPVGSDGSLVFFLDGWHHTEFERSELISREDCLNRLRDWLETNEFPVESS